MINKYSDDYQNSNVAFIILQQIPCYLVQGVLLEYKTVRKNSENLIIIYKDFHGKEFLKHLLSPFKFRT